MLFTRAAMFVYKYMWFDAMLISQLQHPNVFAKLMEGVDSMSL